MSDIDSICNDVQVLVRKGMKIKFLERDGIDMTDEDMAGIDERLSKRKANFIDWSDCGVPILKEDK